MTFQKPVLLGLLGLVALLSQAGITAAQPAAGPPSDAEQQAAAKAAQEQALVEDVTQGALRIAQEDGGIVECPLKHTDVKAMVSGFIAEVRVTQTFHNPTDERIEATYVFPLPHGSAVDEMTMVVGPRRIVGLIKRRAEAREIYQQAIMAGQTAALLEQERPNIFTQSVGNIPPGEEINIEISYIDVLNYDMGNYEFHFPMVVGPRYNPGHPTSLPIPRATGLKGKVSPPEANTSEVPDATRINPPVLRPEFRNGHDIALAVSLDAGVPIQNLSVANHQAKIAKQGRRRAAVTIAKQDSLPNKDFVLRYNVSGKKPEMAVLAHTGNYSGDARRLGNGYFMLMVQPQEDERLSKSPPREIVFMVDVSGSMRGKPTAKTIETMQTMLGLCRPIDTVQVITFAGQANKLFNKAVPVDETSIKTALNFTAGLQGRGGTDMLKGIKMAIDEPLDRKRMRIVVMLTDGYIGNEAQIIEHVGENCGDQIRFWAIGMGSSPNMFLIDGVAKQGGGMGKRLGLEDDSESLSHEIMTRIQRAQLANVKIDWGGLEVTETYPARIPELWAGRPVILFGRYREGGAQQITVSGTVEGEATSWPLEINLSNQESAHRSLAKVWARKKIEDLMHQSFYADSPAIEEEVTAIALDYRLMSQYTSFVAIDADKINEINETARPPRQMSVPVPLPAGTSWEGFFGDSDEESLEAESRGRLSLSNSSPARGIPLSRFRRQALSVRAMPAGPTSRTARQPAQPAGSYYFLGRQLTRTHSRLEGLTRLGASRGSNLAFGFGVQANKSLAKLSEAKESQIALYEKAYRMQPLVAADVKGLVEATEQARKAAAQFEKDGKLAEARDALISAYLFDVAAHGGNESASQSSLAIQADLARIRSQLVKAWSKSTPTLSQELDLVIRDKSLESALDSLQEATKLDIELVAGSTADATAMHGGEPHVHYLDLRHATVAQALDWILLPQRISWRVAGDKIIAASDRRQPGSASWTYDLSLLMPSPTELTEAGDNAPKVALEAGKKLLESLRAKLEVADKDASLTWFGPRHVLVTGDRQRHAAVDQWYAEQLQAIPKEIAQNRKTAFQKYQTSRLRRRIANSHETSGWKLLAAASGGELDLEALTELTIAWRNPQTAELLASQEPVAFRSLWCLTEASRALPEQQELQTQAEAARAISRTAAVKAIAALEENREDAGAFAAVLYSALAMRGDAELVSSARKALLSESETQDSLLATARTVARVLLTEPTPAAITALMAVIQSGVHGEDLTVLLAIACRRAGHESWDTFRRETASKLKNQPLAGSVLILLNRLHAPQLELAAAR